MTDQDNSDDEARASHTRSRFAKFNDAHDADSEESTESDGDDDDNDTTEPEPEPDSDLPVEDSTTTELSENIDHHSSDSPGQTMDHSQSNRPWSDATITDTNTDTDTNTNRTSASDHDSSLPPPEEGSHDISNSTASGSRDSDKESIESVSDSSHDDSGRLWNQISHSDSPAETHTAGDQGESESAPVSQSDSSDEMTADNDQSETDPVKPTQTNSSTSSETTPTTTTTTDVQTGGRTHFSGSQRLLLGEDSPRTWNTGFDQILEAQQPQNLLLLAPASETVDVLRTCQEHPNWNGGEIVIIKTGASVPGDMSVAELSGDGMEESIETHQISNQTNLSRLGIMTTRVLDSWQEPNQKTVCSVHTLQAFLQYLGPQKVFQFLHTLSRRLQSADIDTNYLMTPSDGDRTINTLRPLFDTVIET